MQVCSWQGVQWYRPQWCWKERACSVWKGTRGGSVRFGQVLDGSQEGVQETQRGSRSQRRQKTQEGLNFSYHCWKFHSFVHCQIFISSIRAYRWFILLCFNASRTYGITDTPQLFTITRLHISALDCCISPRRYKHYVSVVK